jgi:hypothetical protein
MATGFDTATTLTSAKLDALVAAGGKFVGGYLTGNYAISKATVQLLSDKGLYFVSIFENGAKASYFTKAQGATDAARAVAAAQALGQPINTPIYFAVDFDCTDAVILSNIVPYFQGIIESEKLSDAGFLLGVYGPKNVCKYIQGSHNDRYTFVAGAATGWSGNSIEYTDWNLYQKTCDTTVGGVGVDIDESNGNGGGWRLAA